MVGIYEYITIYTYDIHCDIIMTKYVWIYEGAVSWKPLTENKIMLDDQMRVSKGYGLITRLSIHFENYNWGWLLWCFNWNAIRMKLRIAYQNDKSYLINDICISTTIMSIKLPVLAELNSYVNKYDSSIEITDWYRYKKLLITSVGASRNVICIK